MEQSEKIDLLAKALNKVQANELFALTDKQNPFFKSKYADLSSVWSVARKPLVDNGLSVVQTFASCGPDCVNIVTTLLHESGQWIRGCLTIPMLKQDPQAAGSAITYGRRYSLSALLGICPDDDDGEKAMKTSRSSTQSRKDAFGQPKPTSGEITDKHKSVLNGLMKDKGMDVEQRKKFFADINPTTSKQGDDFIKNFENVLDDYMNRMDGE